MSHSFPLPGAKKEVHLPASSFTFGPGIADAASPMSAFRLSSNFPSTQPTSHLPPGVPPAVHQGFTFGAENSTDSSSTSSDSSYEESSMDRAPTRASTIAFITPTMNQTAPNMADATKEKETPSSFAYSFSSPVFNIYATTTTTNQQGSSAAPKIHDTGKDKPSLGSISSTPNIPLPNQLGNPSNLFTWKVPSSQPTLKPAGAEKEDKMQPKISQTSQTFGTSFGVGATAFGTGTTAVKAKFAAPTGADVMKESKIQTVINTGHQYISSLNEYEKSLQELRESDYFAGKKDPTLDTLPPKMDDTGKEKDGPSLGNSFSTPTPNFSLPNQFGTSSNLFSNLATGPTAQKTGAENANNRRLFGNSFSSSIPNNCTQPPYSHLLSMQSSIDQLPKPSLTLISKVNYLNFLVGIFTDSSEKNPSRFFFEPVVLLDPEITVNQFSYGFVRQDYLCLTIQMWNLELRSKVLERLKSLPNLANLNIQEDDVCVIPFEEVKLLCDPSKSHFNTIKVSDRPISYLRSQESLDFYLICDSSSSAQVVQDVFRRNPQFTLSNLQLELECKGLCFGAASTNLFTLQINRPTFKFKVEIAPRQVPPKDALHSSIDFKDQMRVLHGKENPEAIPLPSAIPIFSVLKVSDPKNRSFSFTSFDIDIKKGHGEFDLETGLFTVGFSGIYQFNLNTNVKAAGSSAGPATHQIELRVDGEPKVTSHCIMSRSYCDSDEVYCQPVRISTLLSLKLGEKVGIYAASGRIVERPPYCVTRFSAVLFVPTQ